MRCYNCKSKLKPDAIHCSQCGEKYEHSPYVKALILAKNGEEKYFNSLINTLTTHLLQLQDVTTALKKYDNGPERYSAPVFNGRYVAYDIDFQDGIINVKHNGKTFKFKLNNDDVLVAKSSGDKITYAGFYYPYEIFRKANSKFDSFWNWLRYRNRKEPENEGDWE